LFVACGLLLPLLLAGGYGFWRYKLQPHQVRPAAVPFAQSAIRQLTTKGDVLNAVLSPDGKFSSYTPWRKEINTNSVWWLAQTDGSSELQLRPAADVRLSRPGIFK